MNKKITIFAALILGIFLGFIASRYYSNRTQTDLADKPIKIGVVTPLTGDAAYWGEVTRMGAVLAQQELRQEGIDAQFIFEDSQLSATKAATAARKLIDIDKVQAIYSEFNPPAIAVASVVKNYNIIHIYDAAVISPLDGSENAYKTYLNYQTSCEKMAQIAARKGITHPGVLKLNLEFGDICLRGIQTVFPNNLSVEPYNAGTRDFRTQLAKLKEQKVDAIFNVSFQPETIASLKQINELGMNARFFGLTETITPDIIAEYSNVLEGAIMFGMPLVKESFIQKLAAAFPNKEINIYDPAALAYLHLGQLARGLNKCGNDTLCMRAYLDNVKGDTIIGFQNFINHIGKIDTLVQEWSNGKFVPIDVE